MRLNLEKCTFGIKGGNFLGYMISKREIEVKLDKFQEILT